MTPSSSLIQVDRLKPRCQRILLGPSEAGSWIVRIRRSPVMELFLHPHLRLPLLPDQKVDVVAALNRSWLLCTLEPDVPLCAACLSPRYFLE